MLAIANKEYISNNHANFLIGLIVIFVNIISKLNYRNDLSSYTCEPAKGLLGS